MDELTKYLDELESSNIDHQNFYDSEQKLIDIRDNLLKNNDKKNAEHAQIEIEVLNLVKTVKDTKVQIGWKLKGSKKDELGKDGEFVWPDIESYSPEYFDIINDRFNKTNDNFLKQNYGLVLLYGAKSKYKSDEIAISTLDAINALVKAYYKKTRQDLEDTRHCSFDLLNLLKLSLSLSFARKGNNQELNKRFESMRDFAIDLMLHWDPHHKFFRIVSDLSKFFIEMGLPLTDEKKGMILDKLWDITQVLSNKMKEISIEHSLVAFEISRKLGMSEVTKWLIFAAENYVSLADNSEAMGDKLMTTHYLEKALSTYKLLKDDKNMNIIEQRFMKAKQEGGFQTIRTPIPNEVIEDSEIRVKEFLENANPRDVIQILINTPMLPTMIELHEETKKMYEVAPLSAMITRSITDKMGNTIKEVNFNDRESIFYANLLENYSLLTQFAFDELWYLFHSSMEIGKLSLKEIITQIENSWLGTKFIRIYNGVPREILISNSIMKSISMLYLYLESVIKDQNMDIIEIIPFLDSLVLKFEYAFRYICENLSIPTYSEERSGKSMIKTERSINSLLTDTALEKLFRNASLEEDLLLFRFIMTEKSGWNLRNRIAHSIMDPFEYNYKQAFMLIVLFLKLSSYQFKTANNLQNE